MQIYYRLQNIPNARYMFRGNSQKDMSWFKQRLYFISQQTRIYTSDESVLTNLPFEFQSDVKGPVSLNLCIKEDTSSSYIVQSASNICLNSSYNNVKTILIVKETILIIIWIFICRKSRVNPSFYVWILNS